MDTGGYVPVDESVCIAPISVSLLPKLIIFEKTRNIKINILFPFLQEFNELFSHITSGSQAIGRTPQNIPEEIFMI